MPTKTEKTTVEKTNVEKTKAEKTKAEKTKANEIKAEEIKDPKVRGKKTIIENAEAPSSKHTPVVASAAATTRVEGVSSKSVSAKIEKIKADFESLTPAEQRVLITEWSQTVKTTENPITALVELVQKSFGANLTTEIWTEGASHVPVVYCKLVMPDGTEYIASGKNQKIAKLLAAEEALTDLQKA